MSTPSIAIVGSGPSACYLAQALRKHWAAAEISLFERLPVPYGLVRYGVAPDHPGTKAVTRQFERLFEREGIRFVGNIEVGRELPLEALRAAYDIVVLATGLYADRRLGVPGDQFLGVHGAGRLTRRFNDHPDEQDFNPDLGRRCVIVGNGNVAIDVLRLLSKSAEEFDGSQVSASILAHFQRQPLEHIDIVGRSAASVAKFDPVMLRELGQLRHARFSIEPAALADSAEDRAGAARLDTLRALAGHTAANPPRCTIAFHFGWTPERVEGDGRVQGISFLASDGSGRRLRLPADSIITAIGFAEHADQPLGRERLLGANQAPELGRLDHGLYCAGWFKRGPRGTIPDNRLDSRQVADTIIADASNMSLGKPGLSALPCGLLRHGVDHAGIPLLTGEQQP